MRSWLGGLLGRSILGGRVMLRVWVRFRGWIEELERVRGKRGKGKGVCGVGGDRMSAGLMGLVLW